MTGRHKVVALGLLAVLLASAGLWRYLHVMPVGTGETRASPDGRFTASITDWSDRSFLTGASRRWFEYRVEGPGLHHQLTGNPIAGPFFGSRSSHRVIRWSDDATFVEFVFPDTRLRLTVRPGGSCRSAADLTGYEVLQTASGFRVRPLGWQNLRTVREMDVSFHPAAAASSDLVRQHRLGADIVRYDLARESGGSGGDEITMRAERPTAAGILRLEWRGQARDGGEPDLSEAWALMASVDCGA